MMTFEVDLEFWEKEEVTRTQISAISLRIIISWKKKVSPGIK